MEPNGNHDSGYAASNLEEGAHPVMVQEPSPASPKYSLSPHVSLSNDLTVTLYLVVMLPSSPQMI